MKIPLTYWRPLLTCCMLCTRSWWAVAKATRAKRGRVLSIILFRWASAGYATVGNSDVLVSDSLQAGRLYIPTGLLKKASGFSGLKRAWKGNVMVLELGLG